MTVNEARDFFDGEISIARSLQLLNEIGFGYLRLGQPATELHPNQRGSTLYID